MAMSILNFHNNVDQFFLDVTLLHWIFGTRFKWLHILGQNCFCEFQYSGPNRFYKKKKKKSNRQSSKSATR